MWKKVEKHWTKQLYISLNFSKKSDFIWSIKKALKTNNKSNRFLSFAKTNLIFTFLCKKLMNLHISIQYIWLFCLVTSQSLRQCHYLKTWRNVISLWELEGQNTQFLCESVDTNSKKFMINLKEPAKFVFLKTSPGSKL